jgi:mannose-6-phosphate isomerase-like protein (cupin superfamily)
MGEVAVESFDAHQIAEGLGEDLWREFLRVPAMSAGVYRLRAGQEDPQTPHAEDEVYVVLEGRATLRSEGRDVPATPGSVLFVPARAEHRFVDVVQDLVLVVVFAPAESETG